MRFDYTRFSFDSFELPSGWQITTIKKVASINEKSITKNQQPEWIEYVDISSVDKGMIESTRISFSEAPSRARRIVNDNDILISTVRPNLEHFAFVEKSPQNMIASTGFAVVTPKSVEPRYLYYYLTTKHFTEYLSQIAESHTSAYPAVNPDVIEEAELLLPPVSEQKIIAQTLGSLDLKKSNNSSRIRL